jgi:hypothetical protein
LTDLPGLTFVQAPAAPETFNVLLYGHPKTGKSTGAATAPGPILWVNAEGRGALGYARKVAVARGTAIHEVALDHRTGSPSKVLSEVYRHVRDRSEPTVRTVVIDTLGKVRDELAKELVDQYSKNSIQQWGQVADKLIGFVLGLRDLPVNLVLLAHAETTGDDESGRMTGPVIGGKPTQVIPGEVDVVAYTGAIRQDDGTVRYVGQLVETRGRIAGDRSGGILEPGESIRDLDLSEWLGRYCVALTPDETDLPWGAGDDPDAEDVPRAEDGEPEQQGTLA